ncbi:Putative amine oxidase, FAD/NAD(P)-binding domain superfamily [Septoria linicola]|uniref:monoamine oxidase n=1 Tax=Septoria linicola TaxID=215465 RepID=A0A9Q9ENY2_9PEZI|nr:putative amine oxidase, FAD/NAD(P)-binding domain superfamily [Septoria linicola]USW58261.1 Putative amine oxidase, FAD/NAD(P)-binding domain superfamily [Septoria linicola]
MTSRDGYQWTEKTGLVQGVPSIGVIQPPSNIDQAEEKYDVIFVSAGYCGLTAARDAALSGLKVLLLEAPDCIGGRSWSSNIDGYPFEMGGTWVSWGQPHVWREICRYNMRSELELSYDFSSGVNHFTLTSKDGTRNMSHEEEDKLMQSALEKFVNVDGQNGKEIMPNPHDEFRNPEVKKFDKLSVADRMSQIEHQLSPDEYTTVLSFVVLCSSSTPDKTSFYEFLHWWALCNHCYERCIEYLIKYKFHGGQSSFAIKFFQEASATGNLSYAFSTPVSIVKQTAKQVEVRARSGAVYHGSRVISAVPLNILNDIVFDSPMAAGKKAAAETGHVNKCVKVHAECRNPELRSWTGVNYPKGQLMYAIGDGTTPKGNTHIVAFGADHGRLAPQKDIEKTKQALQDLTKMDLERVVFHNWADDEFAKGAWFFSPPGLVTERLDDGEQSKATFTSQTRIGQLAGEASSTVRSKKGQEQRSR